MKIELARCKIDMGAEVEVREQAEIENVTRWELIDAGESLKIINGDAIIITEVVEFLDLVRK